MVGVKNEGVSSGEFEQRIGNLNGIDNILPFDPHFEFSIAHRGLRIIEVFRSDNQGPIFRVAGINLEDVLTRLNKTFLCQEIPPIKNFDRIWNNAPADTNIEKLLLQTGKKITITRRETIIGMDSYLNLEEKFSKILSTLNFKITPLYLRSK